MNWHSLPLTEVWKQLGANPGGLRAHHAVERLSRYGLNELPSAKKATPLGLFLRQFTDFMILVLLAAAILSGLLGEWTDTFVILLIVVVNGIMGFYQEYKAEKAMDALKKMAALQAVVIRDGEYQTIEASGLAPGDVVLVEAGSIVPADMRLFEEHAIQADESALTGESQPVAKTTATQDSPDLPIAERSNMLYKGAMVVSGRGKAVVVATGLQTELGAIARMLQDTRTQTPLQIRLADFGKKLSWIVLAICIILFVVGLLRGEDAFQMLLTAVSLAVAAIPEALPAVVTIALAQGASRMVKQQALVRKLPAVESLGSITYICTDKTGTLTQNRMQVREFFSYNHEPYSAGFSMTEACMCLNSDTRKSADGWTGDPTELALVEYVEHTGKAVEKLQQQSPRVDEVPFDSQRKRMSTIHAESGGYRVWVKGALEAVAERCVEPIPGQVTDTAERWAHNGLRVLAFATRYLDALPQEVNPGSIEHELVFLGIAGMADPPREEAAESVRMCQDAGIEVVMITGDHPATAAAIAREIGLMKPGHLLMSGAELAKHSKAQLNDAVEDIRVYARVSPEQKLSIVQSLQDKGHYVAMTGDGVNDAPALKKAHIGVAMGIAGTDVSKEAADMVLLDDNFATIVKAVREGRHIYDNVRKFIRYILTGNSGEIWTIFLAPFIGLPIPLLPIHILWVNLVTDGLPGLALASEPAEGNIMKRPPRKPGESIFAQGLGWHVLWVGLLISFVCLGVQAWSVHHDGKEGPWQTMVFSTLAFCQLYHVMGIRSQSRHLWQIGLFSNRFLGLTVLLTMLMQLAIVYVPFLQEIFKTQALTTQEMLICLLAPLLVFVAVELEKSVAGRRRRRMKPELQQNA